jgi:hypothetical protein
LVRILDLRSDAEKKDPALDGKECFALIFSGAGGRGVARRFFDRTKASQSIGSAAVPEGLHQLRHDRLGEFPLAVSPAGSDADGPLYSAVINRLYP